MSGATYITPEIRKAAEIWRERREARIASLMAENGLDRETAVKVFEHERTADNAEQRALGYGEDISSLIAKRQRENRRRKYHLDRAKKLRGVA